LKDLKIASENALELAGAETSEAVSHSQEERQPTWLPSAPHSGSHTSWRTPLASVRFAIAASAIVFAMVIYESSPVALESSVRAPRMTPWLYDLIVIEMFNARFALVNYAGSRTKQFHHYSHSQWSGYFRISVQFMYI
jgi:hypothetical protein